MTSLDQARQILDTLLGYLGFPPFAIECFTMYAFVRALCRQRGRAIGI